MVEQVIGISAGILTAVSLVPQLAKMVKEQKPGDISIAMFAILLAGVGLWAAYGFIKQDWPIILTNCFSFTVNLIILFLHIRYKRRLSA